MKRDVYQNVPDEEWKDRGLALFFKVVTMALFVVCYVMLPLCERFQRVNVHFVWQIPVNLPARKDLWFTIMALLQTAVDAIIVPKVLISALKEDAG